MEKKSMEVAVCPTLDWSNVLAVIPTEQLESEAKRKAWEGSREALPDEG